MSIELPPGGPSGDDAGRSGAPFIAPSLKAEKMRIWRALMLEHGSIDGAAALLGTTPATLRARMRKLRLGLIESVPHLRRVK